MFKLSGKVAVVTGGGSGIGQAISKLFGRQGAHVEVLDIDGPAAGDTAAAIVSSGGSAAGAACDVSDAAAVTSAFEQIVTRARRLDILINNAGIAHVGNIERTSEDDLDRLYRVNVKGVFLCTRAAVPTMVKQGVRCNCICPARIHTPFVDGFVKKNYPGREEAVLRELAEYQPMGRMGTPDEVAYLALYLCSDEASFVTGQAYPLDGGVLNQ